MYICDNRSVKLATVFSIVDPMHRILDLKIQSWRLQLIIKTRYPDFSLVSNIAYYTGMCSSIQAELQTTQNERHYSELETTKKPNDQVSNINERYPTP